jgi:hypothetical protein
MNSAVTDSTIALAVVAALAFAVNVWQAFQSRKTIEAATKATEAATRQATASESVAAASLRQAEASEKLAEEAQRDRELDWQPLLTYSPSNESQDGLNRITNQGRGPAYETCVITRAGDRVTISTPRVSIGGGTSYVVARVHDWENPPVTGALPANAAWALYCEDQFGIKYQFLDKGARPVRLRPGEEVTRLWVDVWAHSEPMSGQSYVPQEQIV